MYFDVDFLFGVCTANILNSMDETSQSDSVIECNWSGGWRSHGKPL